MEKRDEEKIATENKKRSRLSNSIPLVRVLKKSTRGHRGYAIIAVEQPPTNQCVFNKWEILVNGSRYGSVMTRIAGNQTLILDPNQSHNITVVASGEDGKVASETTTVLFGAEERKEEQRQAQELREAKERDRKRAEKLEREQREKLEKQRKDREEREKRQAEESRRRASEIEREEEKRQRNIRIGEEQRRLIAGSKPVVKLRSISPQGLAVIEFNEPPDSLGGCKYWALDIRPTGTESWTRVGRGHRIFASWSKGDLPARRRKWLGKGSWDIAITGGSKYGRIQSDVLVVVSPGKKAATEMNYRITLGFHAEIDRQNAA